MWGFSSLKDVLDIILVPIALALIAPWITRRWQDRQRDSQIKTELVTEITGLVMTTVMTVYLFNMRRAQQSMNNDTQENELDRIYRKWRVDTCVIGSKLHAYFPEKEKGDTQIHRRWHCFSDQLTKHCENGMDMNCKKIPDQLEKEKEALFEEKAKIIENILAARITGFRSR